MNQKNENMIFYKLEKHFTLINKIRLHSSGTEMAVIQH